MVEPLWKPTEEQIKNTTVTRFTSWVNEQFHTNLSGYSQLHDWSVSNRETFWSALWDFGGIISSAKGDQVVENDHLMPGARWFPEASLNFAENLLRRKDEHPALIFRGESGLRKTITFAELNRKVAGLSAALKKSGVVKGDRVAGFMPNMLETVIAMLATTSLGAIWSSCSPDFGINGVLDRFGQITPKVLFTADGYIYAGKPQDSLERISGILEQLPGVEKLVVVPYVKEAPDISRFPRAVLFEDFLDQSTVEIPFEQLPFDHPLYIMYSSGTTGVPKCIVHSAGGTLIQHLKELMLHTNLTPQDTIFYYTTCGWMMWNWLVSSLAVGATVVLFDGSPFHPQPHSLFDIVEQEKVTVFGTSAKFIAAAEKAAVIPRKTHDLTHLKAILSTGSPLAPESSVYVYRDVKADLCLSSISGGTDIISCFALGNPALPVYAGELQCLGLGMDVRVFDEAGNSIREQKGELVCVKPFPSMPTGFWNDPDQQKYRAAYFEKFDNIWAHGDYAEITQGNGMIIYGRSDAVLNPGGVRIGTAEIYRQVEKVEQVLESLAIGQDWKGDVRVVLFVKLKPGFQMNDALEKTIRQTIRANTTPRHVPAKIVQVADIPRTISGKIVELAVRNVVHNLPVKNKDALANPEALEYFRNIPSLQED
ncbi:MAG: acetoacetate--CoA ligase [SAR324 cluster bacterium]|nr:acetoacetate--CoA ligase [SAR324 cluster bacterium]